MFTFLSPFVICVVLAFLTACVTASKFNNTVYIISNAETPSLNLPGFTPIGKRRVENCLPEVFKSLNIGLVVSCPFDEDSGLCSQTIATAAPTAKSLGLSVDTSCGAGEEADDDCVANLLKSYAATSDKSMLVVWDLNGMDDLFENLDISDGNDNDDDSDSDDEVPHFDVLTAVVQNHVVSTTSQGCEGIDGQAAGTYRESNRQPAKANKKKEDKKKKYRRSKPTLSKKHSILSRITARWA
ncbi:hypothetical protein CPC08DRAFT_710122 [Agrocybe pediades]|nr:hypothetical protein CPC08DRAFT_710122 [Agrocybe pediades]